MKDVAIYHFRDYWSNRHGYRKNRFAEKRSLDFPNKHDNIPSELMLDDRKDGKHKVDVLTLEGKLIASNLINPHILIRKFSLKSAKKPMFSHLERHLPHLALVFILMNFGFSVVFHLQAMNYELLSIFPIGREEYLMLMHLSNRISIALLIAGSIWLVMSISWSTYIVKDIITSFGCAIAFNALVLIVLIYSGDVRKKCGQL